MFVRMLPAGAQSAPLPRTLRFSICQHAAGPLRGTEWLHEIKHDGHRVAVITDGRGGAVLRSRNGYDVTHRFGAAIGGLAELGRAMVLDGEIAAPDAKGVTHLDGLNEAIDGRSPERLAYFAFDLLHLDGHDLTNCRLEDRKALLSEVLLSAGAPRLAYVQHVERDGPAFFAAACGAGAEGVVSKRRGSRYRSGPCKDWLKAKRHETGDFIVTAFEEIAPGELEALHVAEEIAAELRPCGQIRIGLPSRTLWPALDMLRLPRSTGKAIPVKPRLRVQAKFFGRHRSSIIRDGVVREVSVVE
jgi:bifunctional non-homologous end joining protein LigD